MAQSVLDQWLVRRMGWTASGTPSREQLRTWQFERLRELIGYAKANSSFYARRLEKIDSLPLESLGDFSCFPMTTPDDVCAAPEQFLCVSQDDIARVVTLSSSGTTGRPKRIFHTAEDLEATVDYFGSGMANLVGQGQTAFVLMPDDRPGGVGRLLVDALNRTGARAVTHGVMEDAESAVDHCVSVGADCVVGSSAHVNLMAHAWKRRGAPANRIQSVLLCWDCVPGAVVRTVQGIWGSRVYRHWGMVETGLGGAVECAPGSGMHVRETDVYIEIVNPTTGELLLDGEFGEIVVTTLLRKGMPLIRYRTGDMGRIVPGSCGCGSPMRRLDSLIYRTDDGVDIGTGVLGLRDLNDVMYALDDVADFSANFLPGVLRVVVCGLGDDLAEKVRFALETIPLVRQASGDGIFKIDIVVRPHLVPAVSGLGKRRIVSDLEMES